MVEFPVNSSRKILESDPLVERLSEWTADKSPFLTKPIIRVYAFAAMLVLVLPFIYDIVIRASIGSADYEFVHGSHIALNVFINVLCLVSLLRTKGELRRRFETAMVGVLVNFALLFLLITLFRLYYSRPVLIVSFFASITLVTIVNLLLEKYRERRIGIIPQGMDNETISRVGTGAAFVRSPSEAAHNFDMILVDWAKTTDPRWMEFATRAILSGCEVRHIASYIELKHGRVLAEYFETDHAISLGNTLYLNWYKRVIDIVLVLIALPVALVILAIASVLILLTMGRPIFFTQNRLGVDGQQFEMYKLRSMRSSSEVSSTSATSIGDPRITPLGRYLRRFRIDEIPQFYNILIGDMSLVGPRPEQPELARTYAAKMPAFQCRTLLRPGITGWAQVRGGYAADEQETEKKLSYDLYYLKNASFTTDLSIVVQTCKTLATGNSAR